jgi:SAM-dependent methyltransferase
MTKAFAISGILLLIVSCRSTMIRMKGYIGYYCTTPELAIKCHEDRSRFYEFKKKETVVSIGAEACTNEVVYGFLSDSVNFILENIPSSTIHFKQSQLDFTIDYYDKLFHKKNSCRYAIQIGNDSSTLLSASIADRVLIENTFHEFSEPEKMLEDIYRILKPGGILILFEKLATAKHPIHPDCGKKLYLKEDLIQIMKVHKFNFIDAKIEENVGGLKFIKN